MRLILFVAILFFAITTFGQNSAVSNILLNTFMLKTDTGYATGFIVERNGKEYLVTARHVFKKNNKHNSQISLKILYDSTFKIFAGKLMLHKDQEIDVAVIKLSQSIQKLKPFGVTREITIGQECMFFGFPYGAFFTKDHYGTIPFVKKATVSALADKVTFLDGINNPGFSGGPVVATERSSGQPRIYGVITAYHAEYNLIRDSLYNKIDSLKYYFNSGIIYCYPISYVDEILSRK